MDDVDGPLVRVKDDSVIREIVHIGHSASVSMTILSNAYESSVLNTWLVDCAGYKDRRGYETNLSNS